MEYKAVSTLLSLLVVCLTIEGGTGRSRHIILPPSSTGEEDILIIIVPEDGVRSVVYATLGEEIQLESDLPIWVAVMDTGSRLSSGRLPRLITEIHEEMVEQGMTIEGAHIFLAVHGSRGPMIMDFAREQPDLHRGVILMGSIPAEGSRGVEYPLPTLTFVGELDGVSGIIDAAHLYKSLSRDITFEASIIQNYPIVVLRGCNHALFSDGELPEELKMADIRPEVDEANARMLVANYTVKFVGAVSAQAGYREMSAEMFLSAHRSSGSVLQPIVDVLSLTENESFGSDWVGVLQKWLSGLSPTDIPRIKVESVVLADARSIPPSLEGGGDNTKIITFAEIHRPKRSLSSEIAARMIGPERIQQTLIDTNITQKYNCKDLNYASFQTAYHMASDMARSRYDAHHKGIIFHDDVLMQSDVAWEQSHLLLDVIKHELHVTAPNYQTPAIESLGEWNGIFFCKLLPLDKALEWIYVDSLRRKNQSGGS